MNDPLQATLKKLRLSGLAQSLDVRLQEAAGHNLTHAEFLELILQDELAVRADRLMNRRIRAAMFRELKTLDAFEWAFNPSIKKQQVYDLATGRFKGKSYRLRNQAQPDKDRSTKNRTRKGSAPKDKEPDPDKDDTCQDQAS